ncbi:hypothetical protein V144x_08910 [Gimesia aquarii]|uniref:Uncharacterized protein n=1 Tax=Gimesia aquarii TaxID=2527964 RepID=A0A517VR00_9PLAN|nr:hypothetical protein V144x_08910 [Gimesia aquarii]
MTYSYYTSCFRLGVCTNGIAPSKFKMSYNDWYCSYLRRLDKTQSQFNAHQPAIIAVKGLLGSDLR